MNKEIKFNNYSAANGHIHISFEYILDKYLQSKELNRGKLARKMALKKKELNKKLKNPSLKFVYLICAALKCKLEIALEDIK